MSRFVRHLPIGAEVQPDGSTHFRVWAPDPRDVRLVLECDGGRSRDVAMTSEPDGYYSAHVAGFGHGHRYRYQLDGELSVRNDDDANHVSSSFNHEAATNHKAVRASLHTCATSR